jgi:hypothetical protein
MWPKELHLALSLLLSKNISERKKNIVIYAALLTYLGSFFAYPILTFERIALRAAEIASDSYCFEIS